MSSMKAGVLLLVLAFGSLQAISITDCPCGSLCETKNACPDEKRHESPDDCCRRTRADDPSARENCFHLEPQTDLGLESASLPGEPIVILAIVDRPLFDAAVHQEGDLVSSQGRSPPSPTGPRFLLYSSLII